MAARAVAVVVLVSFVLYLASLQFLPGRLRNTREISYHGRVAAVRTGTEAPAAYVELEAFLSGSGGCCSDSPGARFVRLLRRYVHPKPGAEDERMGSCHPRSPVGQIARCFGGSENYEANAPNGGAGAERSVPVPLLANVTVHEIRRFRGTDRLIARLGTDPACLPLLLAGAAVGDHGVVVELGTFVGLTSRCLGLGLRTTGREGAYYGFDTFSGRQNYNSITRSMPWVMDKHPEYQPEGGRDSFHWLWKMVMADAYPSANSFAGFATADSVHPRVWNNQSVSILSIDSIKSWPHFIDQLGGIRPNVVEPGSIFAFMDFMYTDQPNIVYGCWREHHLIPVYTSWTLGEHWIFVVAKAIKLDETRECLRNIVGEEGIPSQEVLARISRQLDEDLDLVTGLNDRGVSENFLTSYGIMLHNLTRNGLRNKLLDPVKSRSTWSSLRAKS